jgi:hypothetical protein
VSLAGASSSSDVDGESLADFGSTKVIAASPFLSTLSKVIL